MYAMELGCSPSVRMLARTKMTEQSRNTLMMAINYNCRAFAPPAKRYCPTACPHPKPHSQISGAYLHSHTLILQDSHHMMCPATQLTLKTDAQCTLYLGIVLYCLAPTLLIPDVQTPDMLSPLHLLTMPLYCPSLFTLSGPGADPL